MKALRVLLAIASVLFTSWAVAGTGGGKILQIMVHHGGANGQGIVIFTTEFNSSKPTCSNATDWAISLNNEYGKALFALLLSAQAQQKSINVLGSGDCADWGDRERPLYVSVVP